MSESQKPGVPAAPIAPGNFDRAWNDPPLFRYLTSTDQVRYLLVTVDKFFSHQSFYLSSIYLSSFFSVNYQDTLSENNILFYFVI